MDIRSLKLAELIKVKLSILLVKGLKDPRLDSFITILDVRLSRDGRTAQVVVSVIGSEKDKSNVIRGLESARGYIQMRLGKELRVKYIPHLIFKLDDKTEERVRLVHRLEELEKRVAITGNSTVQMQRARNRSAIDKLAESLGLHIPKTLIARTLDEAYSNCDELSYPCIIRPPSSGGGTGISLVSEPSQVKAACWRLQADIDSPEVIVQQYIGGFDVSSSVLSTDSEAIVLSVQGQLIGMPSAGRNCDFVYSGNFMPMRLSESVKHLIVESSESICATLKLQGTNGIDFVVDKNDRVWFLENNPRFQGTLEMLERGGNISVAELHTAACNGRLPSEIPTFSPSIKLVVFSRRTGKVPDLSKYENTVDRTPEGVLVNRGDPVCTIIETSSSLPDCYNSALTTSNAIQRAIK